MIFKEKVSLAATAAVYLLFNLRLSPAGLLDSLAATGWQILSTAPYAAGLTFLIVSLLQRISEEKMPRDRILRLFFTVGIVLGLLFAMNEYWLTG